MSADQLRCGVFRELLSAAYSSAAARVLHGKSEPSAQQCWDGYQHNRSGNPGKGETMTWVPRTPKRPDFCGCPPCPLCFCWAGDDGLVDGMTKFTQDMLGGKIPSANEKQVLKDAAEAIHVANLSVSERIDAEIREADRMQHIQRQADATLAQIRAESARPESPKKDTRPTLDDMDPAVFEKPKEWDTTFVWGSVGRSPIVTIFDEFIKQDMDKAFTQLFAESVDLAAPAKKDAKEIQADFAREEAKKRMREMARVKR